MKGCQVPKVAQLVPSHPQPREHLNNPLKSSRHYGQQILLCSTSVTHHLQQSSNIQVFLFTSDEQTKLRQLNFSLDIGFGSDGASVTRFPNPVAPTQHRFEAAAQTPPSAFAPQPVRVAARSGGGEEAGKQQARHDEALRQNALHRQMLFKFVSFYL